MTLDDKIDLRGFKNLGGLDQTGAFTSPHISVCGMISVLRIVSSHDDKIDLRGFKNLGGLDQTGAFTSPYISVCGMISVLRIVSSHS